MLQSDSGLSTCFPICGKDGRRERSECAPARGSSAGNEEISGRVTSVTRPHIAYYYTGGGRVEQCAVLSKRVLLLLQQQKALSSLCLTRCVCLSTQVPPLGCNLSSEGEKESGYSFIPGNGQNSWLLFAPLQRYAVYGSAVTSSTCTLWNSSVFLCDLPFVLAMTARGEDTRLLTHT